MKMTTSYSASYTSIFHGGRLYTMFTIWLSMCIMSGTYLCIRRWWLLLFALVIFAAVLW